MTPQLIGFAGYAEVGKDSAADALCSIGWERVAFADPLRGALLTLNPVVYDQGCVRVQEAVTAMGWTAAKRTYPEIRRLLQVLGTEVCRGNFGKDCWVKIAENRIRELLKAGKKVVVTDVRFENEAALIHKLRGVVVRIHRPGRVPVNAHVSDAQRFDANHELTNDGTLDDLHDQVRSLLGMGMCNR